KVVADARYGMAEGRGGRKLPSHRLVYGLLVKSRAVVLGLGLRPALLFEDCGEILHDDRRKVGRRNRAAKQIALDEIAFELAKECDLFFGRQALLCDRQS